MERLKTTLVKIGESVVIGGGADIVVQSMCNTHTDDEKATFEQCLRLEKAGAQMVRITVPSLKDVEHIRNIRAMLRDSGSGLPLVADVHFSSQIALEVAPHVEKVRINPGNFASDHSLARERFKALLEVCKKHGTAIRIGLNHGSLGSYITDRYGNTPQAMAIAAMEWVRMCREQDFHNVVVSLKASNTLVMTEAYRLLAGMMAEEGEIFPLHLGVTEAGGGLSGRIKSCVGIASLLQEGIGDTLRVSLTEEPEAEIPVARYLADFAGQPSDGLTPLSYGLDKTMLASLDAAVKWGPKLLKREIDSISEEEVKDGNLREEIMQAARRRFYKPEYIACPGCGRTMYDLQGTFEKVKQRTSHLKGMVIAVMGCIVNGPGEMADADWGYVGEGKGMVSIYRKGKSVLRHVSEDEAIDKLLELIEQDSRESIRQTEAGL
ncbi:MAG: (E)-4-hydroxy-3-methylbut-2-enyl-diphosphate synthase [Candidatus Cryptobacteroides sp.]|nr:(E)-4-hydroxy-3-methylbut-2-enyl-diphosphate synthase [Bacteroidales bacterium]